MNNKVKNIKPLGLPWETKDPFIMAMHHDDAYPAGNDKMGIDFEELSKRNTQSGFVEKDGYRMYNGTTVPGFPYHPHRGFETITIGKKGFVDHADSLGGAGRFGAGDVEWMTAGKGIQHAEMFPLINDREENPLEIFQIWINLPAKNKLVNPAFKMLWEDTIPKVVETDKNKKETHVEVVAGEYKHYKAPAPTPDSWAADPENGVGVLTVKMAPHAEWTLPADKIEGINRTLYFYRGNTLEIEGDQVQNNHAIEFNATEDVRIVNGNEEAYFLLLQGKPINEPIAARGPFVMNTEEELNQAFREYRKTQFGGWPWPEVETVHARTKGRFALYPDGTEELKE